MIDHVPEVGDADLSLENPHGGGVVEVGCCACFFSSNFESIHALTPPHASTTYLLHRISLPR